MFWIAWPAAPLTMLSIAETTTSRPVRPSKCREMCQRLAYFTFFRFATSPARSIRTNGSPAYACS